ncbi:hypothetical protein MMC13_006255 [Lambiella insularis]|nr:hypothetical protein [Lambiella insularis]
MLRTVTVGATHHAQEAFHDLLRGNDATCNVTCGCVTLYSTYNGEASLLQPPPISTSTFNASPTTSSTLTTSISKSNPPLSSPTSKSAAPSPSTSSTTSPNPGSSALIASSSKWCMTYSPYTPTGQCASAAQVSSDIASIAAKGFSSVRLYSTDCAALSTVAAACATHNLQLVLGIYISDTGIPDAEPQLDDITTHFAGDYTLVSLVVVGNEALFNDYCSAPALASFIIHVKRTLVAAGYTGPVTTAEPPATLREYAAALCPVVDVLAANIHPFFDPDTAPAQAGTFVAQQLAELERSCPGGKKALCTETGWPRQGQPNGRAVPGVEEQRVAVAALVRAVGAKAVLSGFGDDEWKAEGAFGVERSWGCGGLFG